MNIRNIYEDIVRSEQKELSSMMNEYPTAQQLALALGGRRTGGQWVAKCPAHDDSRPSLSIKQGDGRPILNCFAGCDARDVIGTLRAMGLWPEFMPGVETVAPARRNVTPAGPSAAELANIEAARRIYDRAFPCIMSTPCEKYLVRRGIWEAAGQNTSMRYARLTHPETGEADVPCLVIPRHDPETMEIRGIQRIYLTPDGRKYTDGTAKLSLGVAPGSLAMLHGAGDADLTIGEGAESAFAAMLLFGGTAAAACCGPFPAAIKLPAWVASVMLAADHDTPTLPNGKPKRTSAMKAATLAEFIQTTGRPCRVFVPAIEKTDAVDELARIRAETMEGQKDAA